MNILTQTLQAVDKAWYQPGIILECYDESKSQAVDREGDTLALFIVRELCELYDPDTTDEANAREFGNALLKAVQDLEGAENAAQAMYAHVQT